MKLSDLQQPTDAKPKLKLSDVLNNKPESVASEGWEFLENHPFKSVLQGLPETLTGKSLEQRANEMEQQDFVGQSKTKPYDKNLGTVRPLSTALTTMAQVGDVATSPSSYIPAGKLVGKAAEKLAPGLIKGLKESAGKSYGKALGATTKTEKELAQKVMPGLLEKKPIFMTRQNLLDKADKNVEKYGVDIDKEFANVPKQTRVNIEPILENIKKSQDGLTINKVVPEINKERFEHLEKMKLDFINTMKSMSARPEFVRQYRQALDGIIEETKKGFKMTGTGGAALRAQRTMANSIRGELAQKFPNIARLNKEFSLWSNLQELLETTAPKTKSPLSALHAFGTAHAGGAPWLGIFVNLNKLVTDNVLWNSISGNVKARLADYMAKGDFKNASRIMDSMKMLSVNNSKATQPIYDKDVNPTLKSNGLSLDKILGIDDANADEVPTTLEPIIVNKKSFEFNKDQTGSSNIDMNKDEAIESSHNAKAVSSKGAVGEVQVTKSALADFNKDHNTKLTMDDMKDADKNRKVGGWYMNTKIPRYLKHYKIRDTKENRLRAYNEGVGNLKKGLYPKETRDYVKRYDAQ